MPLFFYVPAAAALFVANILHRRQTPRATELVMLGHDISTYHMIMFFRTSNGGAGLNVLVLPNILIFHFPSSVSGININCVLWVMNAHSFV